MAVSEATAMDGRMAAISMGLLCSARAGTGTSCRWSVIAPRAAGALIRFLPLYAGIVADSLKKPAGSG